MLRSLQDGAPPLVLGGPGLLPTDIEILPELQALSMRAVVGIDRIIDRSFPPLPIEPESSRVAV